MKVTFRTRNQEFEQDRRLFHLLQRHWWSDRCNAYVAQSWAVVTIHWCFKDKS